MNQLAHFFITYFLLSFIIEDIKAYLIPVIVFAIILDLDHIPGYIRYASIGKKVRKNLKIKDYVDIFRTSIQEPIGILVIEGIIFALYLFGVNETVLLIAALSIGIHWIIDFLTVHTRPFAPFNDKIVVLFFKTVKDRKVSETAITVVSFALFSYVWF